MGRFKKKRKDCEIAKSGVERIHKDDADANSKAGYHTGNPDNCEHAGN